MLEKFTKLMFNEKCHENEILILRSACISTGISWI